MFKGLNILPESSNIPHRCQSNGISLRSHTLYSHPCQTMFLKRIIVICLDKVNTTDASHHKVEEKSPDEVFHCPLTVIRAQIASSINRNVSLSLFCFMYHFFMAIITMRDLVYGCCCC